MFCMFFFTTPGEKEHTKRKSEGCTSPFTQTGGCNAGRAWAYSTNLRIKAVATAQNPFLYVLFRVMQGFLEGDDLLRIQMTLYFSPARQRVKIRAHGSAHLHDMGAAWMERTSARQPQQ